MIGPHFHRAELAGVAPASSQDHAGHSTGDLVMAQRTSDNGGNENLRAGEQRAANMEANAREAHSADRAFHQNVGVTHANAGVQMLDLDSENAESQADASDG